MIRPAPQRDWLLILLVGLGVLGYFTISAMMLLDQVVTGAFEPALVKAPPNTKELEDTVRAHDVLKRLTASSLEQSGEGE